MFIGPPACKEAPRGKEGAGMQGALLGWSMTRSAWTVSAGNRLQTWEIMNSGRGAKDEDGDHDKHAEDCDDADGDEDEAVIDF